MTSLKLFGAALVVAAFVAAPAVAQQAVQEPGAAAFYHPDADILHAGSPAPSNAFAAMRSGDVVAAQMVARSHRRAMTMKR
jgi:hypothetical protein